MEQVVNSHEEEPRAWPSSLKKSKFEIKFTCVFFFLKNENGMKIYKGRVRSQQQRIFCISSKEVLFENLFEGFFSVYV